MCTPEIYGTKHCFLASKIRPKKGRRPKFPNFAKFGIFANFCKIFGSHSRANLVKMMFCSVNFGVHEEFPGDFRGSAAEFSPNFDEIWSKFWILVEIWSKFSILVEISIFYKIHILSLFVKKRVWEDAHTMGKQCFPPWIFIYTRLHLVFFVCTTPGVH